MEEGRSDHEVGDHAERERARAFAARRGPGVAAGRAPRRAQADRRTRRLRTWGLRSLHGAPRRRAGSLVPDVRAPGEGHEVETVESMAENGALSDLQQAFVDNLGLQCGYCTPGMLLTAKAALERNPNPTEDEVRDAISGNLCRCTGYDGIIKSIMAVAGRSDMSAREPEVGSARASRCARPGGLRAASVGTSTTSRSRTSPRSRSSAARRPTRSWSALTSTRRASTRTRSSCSRPTTSTPVIVNRYWGGWRGTSTARLLPARAGQGALGR